MTAFDAMLSADARSVFPSDFGEIVTYYAEGQEWDGRELLVVVQRQPLSPIQFGDTNTLVREALLHVQTADVPQVEKGRDKVELPLVYGQAPKMARVTEVHSGDAGFWRVTVQW